MGYLFLFFIGFGLAIAGGVTLIAYLNFLPAGITWIEYFIFIRSRIEVYLLPIGIIIITVIILKNPFYRRM